MDFGLNLILTFTDNATSQLDGVVSSIQNVVNVTNSMDNSLKSIEGMASLSSLAASSQQVGSTMMSMGESVGSVLTGLVSKVIGVGSEFESFGVTLEQLYGSEKAVNEQLDKLLQFSATTPFEIEDVKDLVTVLKSQGLEAFQNMRGEVSGLNQQTLAWIGDIMAFKPDIPASRWRLAFTNFLGSGVSKVLENALDMGKIADTIGHSIGDTAEERMNSLVEFIEKKDLGGLMAKNMGTWQQTISNLDDTFTMLLRDIANTGAFDNFKVALNNIAGALIELDETGRLQKLATVIGDALDPIAQAAIKATALIKQLIINVVDFADEHPKLVKITTTFAALFSVIMVAGGAAMLVLSKFAFAALTIMELQKITGMLSVLSGSFLTFGATLGIAWAVWHSNLFGLQKIVFDFVSGLIDAWNVASEATAMFAEDMMSVYNNLDRNTFFGNLTAGLIKAIIFIQALADAWSDGEMDAELYEKAVAVGVIDLVSRILDLKYRVEEFIAGFKKGWAEANEAIGGFVKNVAKNLKGTIFTDIFDAATQFFTFLTSASLDDWNNFGEDVGKLAPKILATGTAFRILGGAVKGLSGVGKVLGGLGKIKLPKLNIGKVLFGGGVSDALNDIALQISQTNIGSKIINGIFNSISKASGSLSTIGTTIATAITGAVSGAANSIALAMSQTGIGATVMNGIATAIEAVAGASAATIGAVIAAVLASVIAFAFKNPEEFKEKVSTLWDSIVEGFTNVWDKLKNFFDPIVTGFQHLSEAIGNFVSSIKGSSAFQTFIELLSDIGRVITDVLTPILTGLIDVFTTVFGNIVNIVSSVFGDLIDIISGIINVISGIISGDFSQIGQGVSQIFTGIVNNISSIFGGAVDVVRSIVNLILTTGLGLLRGALSLVQGVFNGVLNSIRNTMNNILTIVQNIVTSILRVLGFEGAAAKVSSVFNAIKSAISNAINAAKNVVQSGIDAIKGAFNFSWHLPPLSLPHLSVSGGEAPFGIGGKGSLPQFSVSWYKEGGVFDEPSVIGVGEAGQEAVMPLEQNTGWIDMLAGKIVSSMSIASPQISVNSNTPLPEMQPIQSVDSVVNVAPTPVQTTGGTVDNSTNSTDARVDNSVHFSEGSIVIQNSGGNEVDARALAVRIMEEIARMQKINNAMNYGINYSAGGA